MEKSLPRTHKDVEEMAVMDVQPEAITQLWGQVLQAVRGRLTTLPRIFSRGVMSPST